MSSNNEQSDSSSIDHDDHDDHDCSEYVIFDTDEVSITEDYAIEIDGVCDICGHDVIGQHILYTMFSPELDEHIYERNS